MALLDLAEGDILVQSGADHCVMWVGSDKPLAHATADQGVIQQSDEYFQRMAPVVLGDHTVWRLRSRAKVLSDRAAATARDWAVIKGRTSSRTATPFGTKRWLKTYLPNISDEQEQQDLTSTWNAAAEVFDAQSVYEVLKMYTRSIDPSGPLSKNKGVTCSQFVIYCYQIASLHNALKGGDATQMGIYDPRGLKAREIQMGATETKDGNALLAAEEALTEYHRALRKIQKFKQKKDDMQATLGSFSSFFVQNSLLPSLQTTTRFLTSDFLVQKFLPKSFDLVGFYLPYCGEDVAKGPTIVEPPLRSPNTFGIHEKTLFKVDHQKVFAEPV